MTSTSPRERSRTAAHTSPIGSASIVLDIGAPPAGSGPHPILPGSTRDFQFWLGEPQVPGGTGVDLTEGLKATFCN